MSAPADVPKANGSPDPRRIVAAVTLHLCVQGRELSLDPLVFVPPAVAKRMAEALEHVARELRQQASPIILPGLPRPGG